MGVHLLQKARATAATCHQGILRGRPNNEHLAAHRRFIEAGRSQLAKQQVLQV